MVLYLSFVYNILTFYKNTGKITNISSDLRLHYELKRGASIVIIRITDEKQKFLQPFHSRLRRNEDSYANCAYCEIDGADKRK